MIDENDQKKHYNDHEWNHVCSDSVTEQLLLVQLPTATIENQPFKLVPIETVHNIIDTRPLQSKPTIRILTQFEDSVRNPV